MNNCLKCSDNNTDCLECVTDYKLIGNKCIKPTIRYLALPQKLNKETPFSLNIDNLNLEKENMLTISIWIKYMGPIDSSNSECVKIFYFNKDNKTYICHNRKENSIELHDQDRLAFNFPYSNQIIGFWSVFSISFYSNFNTNHEKISNLNLNKYFFISFFFPFQILSAYTQKIMNYLKRNYLIIWTIQTMTTITTYMILQEIRN